MIRSIAAISYADERLELTLNDPYEDGIAVLNVDGIGPAKATIHTSSIASNDGDAFNGARVGGRNISLTLGLLTQPDVERAVISSIAFFSRVAKSASSSIRIIGIFTLKVGSNL